MNRIETIVERLAWAFMLCVLVWGLIFLVPPTVHITVQMLGL